MRENSDPDIVKIIDSPEGPIPIYAPHTLDKMRAAGRLAAETLDYVTPHVTIGTSTEHLNQLAYDFIMDHGAIAAPLNYKGFPKSICTSINHVICHGIPNAQTKLKKGDIVNIDVTVILDGWYGDTSRMFFVGPVNRKAARLTEATFHALHEGIKAVKPGNTTNDIGRAIEDYIKPYNYGIVRDFCGHGLGKKFHDNPGIMHYARSKGGNVELVPGMYFTIEPMINTGTHRARILPDGWTAITSDRGLSAQFEHSMAVTEEGVEIFTKSPKGWDFPPYQL